MYYEDMSHYSYRPSEANTGLVNIGWLDDEHPYTKRETSEDFRDRLLLCCFMSVNQTRGFHGSPFETEKQKKKGIWITYRGTKKRLGSAEIRILGVDGTLFASPDLIYHYVVDANYCPPDTFIESVMNTRNIQIGGKTIYIE